jgi:hypothetical protein
MPRHLFLFTLPVSTLLVTLIFFAPPSSADIPQVISYQGKVTDTGGTPVADGSYTMRFHIYDALSGGTLEWDSGNRSIQVTGGIFSVLLGESPQPSINLPFDEDYWLLVTVGGDNQIPRQRLGSVGYAYVASGLVPGTEVSGSLSGGSAAVLKATNTATSGTSFGVRGSASSTYGWGVYGQNTISTRYGTLGGPDYGVYGYGDSGVNGFLGAGAIGAGGVSSSTSGRGVIGEASATTGSTFGGRFESASNAGTGVYGRASATSGVATGVYGLCASSEGRAVFGNAAALTGTTYGGYFENASSNGRAVYGNAFASTGNTTGVFGGCVSPTGTGVYGYAWSSTGDAIGVTGWTEATSGWGVYAQAASSTGDTYGVYAASNSNQGTGVYGKAEATSGATYGVHGRNSSSAGIGVYGQAISLTGVTYGVHGESNSTTGRGVDGLADATSGSTYGVYGRSASTSGTGVRGNAYATVGTNYGVYGQTFSGSGYGVYYVGGLAGTGTKSCVVKTSQGPTLMYCQESPENWFEDFGEGQLVNGRCHIEFDPLFLETVTINAANPMKVFLQPQDPECEGLAAVPGTTGFDAIELRHGRSNGRFTYRVVAKRKGFEDKRLDYCAAAETDSYLYPELREKELQELHSE